MTWRMKQRPARAATGRESGQRLASRWWHWAWLCRHWHGPLARFSRKPGSTAARGGRKKTPVSGSASALRTQSSTSPSCRHRRSTHPRGYTWDQIARDRARLLQEWALLDETTREESETHGSCADGEGPLHQEIGLRLQILTHAEGIHACRALDSHTRVTARARSKPDEHWGCQRRPSANGWNVPAASWVNCSGPNTDRSGPSDRAR